MKNRKLIILALALVLLLVVAIPVYRALAPEFVPAELPMETPAASTETAAPAVLAPDFAVYDAEGNAVRLSDYRGKPVVINFWATWCPPCREELPHFDAAFQARGEELVFLMVDLTDGSRETVDTVRAFLDDTGYSFPVYYDTDFDAAAAYAVSSIPLTVLIDAQGQKVISHLGSMSAQQLDELLNLLG